MGKLTKAQRARLDKLATYLEALPADYSHFDMRDFLDLEDTDPTAIKYLLENGGVASCGTAACAVGHGPAAGVLAPRRFVKGGRIDWVGYSELFVQDYDESRGPWDWCFSGIWDSCDNSHYGAAARIRYLLAAGTPPLEFNDYGGYERSIRLYAPYRIDAKAPANA